MKLASGLPGPASGLPGPNPGLVVPQEMRIRQRKLSHGQMEQQLEIQRKFKEEQPALLPAAVSPQLKANVSPRLKSAPLPGQLGAKPLVSMRAMPPPPPPLNALVRSAPPPMSPRAIAVLSPRHPGLMPMMPAASKASSQIPATVQSDLLPATKKEPEAKNEPEESKKEPEESPAEKRKAAALEEAREAQVALEEQIEGIRSKQAEAETDLTSRRSQNLQMKKLLEECSAKNFDLEEALGDTVPVEKHRSILRVLSYNYLSSVTMEERKQMEEDAKRTAKFAEEARSLQMQITDTEAKLSQMKQLQQELHRAQAAHRAEVNKNARLTEQLNRLSDVQPWIGEKQVQIDEAVSETATCREQYHVTMREVNHLRNENADLKAQLDGTAEPKYSNGAADQIALSDATLFQMGGDEPSAAIMKQVGHLPAITTTNSIPRVNVGWSSGSSLQTSPMTLPRTTSPPSSPVLLGSNRILSPPVGPPTFAAPMPQVALVGSMSPPMGTGGQVDSPPVHWTSVAGPTFNPMTLSLPLGSPVQIGSPVQLGSVVRAGSAPMAMPLQFGFRAENPSSSAPPLDLPEPVTS